MQSFVEAVEVTLKKPQEAEKRIEKIKKIVMTGNFV